MQSFNNIARLVPETIFVPPGASLGVYVPAVAGETYKHVKFFSGASLVYLLADNNGSTMDGGTLAANYNSSMYFLVTAAIISVPGPATFYLVATGATAQVQVIRSISPQSGI